jgi:hypothetical protein
VEEEVKEGREVEEVEEVKEAKEVKEVEDWAAANGRVMRDAGMPLETKPFVGDWPELAAGDSMAPARCWRRRKAERVCRSGGIASSEATPSPGGFCKCCG